MAETEKTLKYIIYTLIIGAFVSCLFIFKNWIFPYITSKSIPFRIIVELMSVAYIVLALNFPKYRPRKSWILYSLLIFTAIAIITSIFGLNPKLSFTGDLERMWGINMWLHLTAFFIIVSNVLKTKKEWFTFFNIVLVFCSYIAFYGYLQRWGVEGLFQTNIARIQSLLGNSAYVAGILLLSSILSFYLLFKTKGFWWKFLFALHILIQLPAMFLAEIRGAQVAFFLVLLLVSIVCLFKLKNKKAKYGIVALLLLLVIIFGLAFNNKEADWVKNNSVLHRLTSITLSGGTARTRLISWEGGLKAWQERPFRGYGMENYYYSFDKYFQADYYNIASSETWFDRAHNMVVENLVAHGILGLLAYLSIFIFTLFYIYKIYKKDPEENWMLSLFLSSLVIAYFVQNFFVFDSLGVTMVFFFFLAYINYEICNHLEKEVIFQKKLSEFANGIIISLVAIVVFYLVFGMNLTHIRVAQGSYEIQRSFYQDQDLLKTGSKIQDLFKIDSYLNRDSITMTTDTLTKVTPSIKTQEQAQAAFKIIDFLINEFKKQDEINNQDAYLKLNLTRLYILKAGFLQGNQSESIKVLQEAQKVIQESIELSPERLHNYYFDSKIKMALGNYQGAIDTMKRALSYNKNYAETYLYLAQAYAAAGNTEQEQENLKKAYELKPSLRDK